MATKLTKDEMLALMARHDEGEVNQDVAATMATVAPVPFYEFQPMGMYIETRDALTEMYRRVLPTQSDAINGAVRKNFWFNADGYAVEWEFDIVDLNGTPRKSHVITVFDFEDGLVKGERVFLSPEHSDVFAKALGDDFFALPGVRMEAAAD